MHLERAIVAALIAAIAVGLIGSALWALTLGCRLMYLIHRRHPDLWREFNFRLSFAGPYSPAFANWLRLRHFERINDVAIVRLGRALLDSRPVIALMVVASILAARYAASG